MTSHWLLSNDQCQGPKYEKYRQNSSSANRGSIWIKWRDENKSTRSILSVQRKQINYFIQQFVSSGSA